MFCRDANDTLKKMEKSTDITEDERKEGEEENPEDDRQICCKDRQEC